MSHDYSHCARESCPKAKTCFRAWLHREDLRIKKAHPEQKMWCTYFMDVKPDENGDCENKQGNVSGRRVGVCGTMPSRRKIGGVSDRDGIRARRKCL